MLLSELLNGFMPSEAKAECEVTGLALDSRHVKPGDVFFAYPGAVTDGRKFIHDAIINGAHAIVVEADENISYMQAQNYFGRNIEFVAIQQLQRKIGEIAAQFYHHPSHEMTVIGATGTNGKTSCTQCIAQSLQRLNQPCAVLGTLGSGFPGQLNTSLLTTPDPISVQKFLYEYQQQGAKAAAMEVSSHSLDQGRVNGVAFDIAVFTNLSRDHLDYHATMQNYWQAKKRLFVDFAIGTAIINIDDPYGRELLGQLPVRTNAITYGIENSQAEVSAENVKLTAQGIQALIKTPWGSGVLQSQLLGRFNLSNLLAVMAVLAACQITFEQALDCLAKLPQLNGRMQTFGGNGWPTIVIDYAHTPDALEQTLKALREHCQGELWCVFGCGGERDQGKRPLIGQIAERLADQLIITNDNPRNEMPEEIVKEIKQGLLCPWAAEVEFDRRAAIAHALECAKSDDIVLIAGKGHEHYQQIGDAKYPFNDAEVVKDIVNTCSARLPE